MIIEFKDNLEELEKFGKAALSHDGNFCYIELNETAKIFNLKRMEFDNFDVPKAENQTIRFSPTKYNYQQVIAEDSVVFKMYDVAKREKLKLVRAISDNRPVPFSGYKENGIFPLSGEPIYFQKIKSRSMVR